MQISPLRRMRESQQSCKCRESLADCEICVLLIGPGWLGLRADGGAARVFDERDFVRLEVALALASGRKVLPILANEAQMPKRADLPEDLQRLARINALSIRHASFERDLEYLVDTLLARKKSGNPVSDLDRHRVLAALVSAIAGLLAAAALLLLGAALHEATADRSLEQTLGGRGEVLMVVAAVLLGGTVAGLLLRRRKR